MVCVYVFLLFCFLLKITPTIIIIIMAFCCCCCCRMLCCVYRIRLFVCFVCISVVTFECPQFLILRRWIKLYTPHLSSTISIYPKEQHWYVIHYSLSNCCFAVVVDASLLAVPHGERESWVWLTQAVCLWSMHIVQFDLTLFRCLSLLMYELVCVWLCSNRSEQTRCLCLVILLRFVVCFVVICLTLISIETFRTLFFPFHFFSLPSSLSFSFNGLFWIYFFKIVLNCSASFTLKCRLFFLLDFSLHFNICIVATVQ